MSFSNQIKIQYKYHQVLKKDKQMIVGLSFKCLIRIPLTKTIQTYLILNYLCDKTVCFSGLQLKFVQVIIILLI